MADPAEIDIIADRNVPYTESFAFLGEDWTGSTLRLQVRLTRDTTGTPLADGTSPSGIGIGYAGTDTVANHVAAGRLTSEIYGLTNPATGNNYTSGDRLLMTQMETFIVVSGYPFPAERGDDLVTYYDIIREPPSGPNLLVVRGTITVRAGVTIP